MVTMGAISALHAVPVAAVWLPNPWPQRVSTFMNTLAVVSAQQA
jgi:hypothetical protein